MFIKNELQFASPKSRVSLKNRTFFENRNNMKKVSSTIKTIQWVNVEKSDENVEVREAIRNGVIVKIWWKNTKGKIKFLKANRAPEKRQFSARADFISFRFPLIKTIEENAFCVVVIALRHCLIFSCPFCRLALTKMTCFCLRNWIIWTPIQYNV